MPMAPLTPADKAASLATLLGLQRTDPRMDMSLRGNTSDAQYDEMIPEEDLYQQQEQYGSPDHPYAVPSRESLRGQGVARLKQLFAMKAAEAEPERLRGEYGLESERIRGRSALDVARTNREASSKDKEAAFTQQEYLTRLRGEQTATNARATQDAVASRGQTTQSGQMERLQQADKFRRAAELRKQAASVNPIMNVFTGRREKLTQEAEGLSATSGDNEIGQLANFLATDPRTAGKSLEELVQSGIVEVDSPEEMQALQQAWQLTQTGR